MPFDNGDRVALSPAAEALLQAAAIVETRHAKHTRATRIDGVLHHCALGALEAASGRRIDCHGGMSYVAAGLALARQLPFSQLHAEPEAWDWKIAQWNNAPERTGPEVAAMMRRAAQFC